MGRLVYQVIGRDGPIFNPRNIAYLDPSSAVETATNLSALAVGLSGASLIAGIGAIAISAATLKKCDQILRAITELAGDVAEMKETLQAVERRVKRIDTKVAETHLREALKHACRNAFTDDGIDFAALHCLAADIDGFEETLDEGFLFNFGLRLTSDVRAELRKLLALCANLRCLVAQQHNVKVDCDPERLAWYRSVDDYLPLPFSNLRALVFHFHDIDHIFSGFSADLGNKLNSDFFFSGEEDVQKFREFARDNCFRPVWQARWQNWNASAVESLLNALDVMNIDWSADDLLVRTTDIGLSWVWNSDASLLLRTRRELEGLRDGYENTFYYHLRGDEKEEASEAEMTFAVDPSEAEE